MKKFIFKTTATMKEYNDKKCWIDSGVIRDIYIAAEDISEALNQYRKAVAEKSYIEISNTAMKNKSAMYRETADGDDAQIGYVITGKTEFQKDSGEFVNQYIDLWVEFLEGV